MFYLHEPQHLIQAKPVFLTAQSGSFRRHARLMPHSLFQRLLRDVVVPIHYGCPPDILVERVIYLEHLASGGR